MNGSRRKFATDTLVPGVPLTTALGPFWLGAPAAVVGEATATQASSVVADASPDEVATISLWFSPVL